MITVKNLKKSFINGEKEFHVLRGINLRIEEGEFIAITGRSGSGKSTLLYQLGLLDMPTSGDIVIDGYTVTEFSDSERTRFRLNYLGYVFQDYAVLPTLTALENVLVPLLMQGVEETQARADALEALAEVGLAEHADKVPSKLSGGQQQRVAIARAIAHKPKILFADEPTANLDAETSDQVLDVFVKLNKRGQTLVMVTHEPDYAKLAHRTLLLADGVFVEK